MSVSAPHADHSERKPRSQWGPWALAMAFLLKCGRKTQLKVRRLGEILVFLAFGRAAELLDRLQLIFREIVFALDDIGLAEIFAHLRIFGSSATDLDNTDALLGASQFAGRVAAIVQGARRIGILQHVEHLQRLLIALGLGEREGVFGKSGIGQHPAVFSRRIFAFADPRPCLFRRWSGRSGRWDDEADPLAIAHSPSSPPPPPPFPPPSFPPPRGCVAPPAERTPNRVENENSVQQREGKSVILFMIELEEKRPSLEPFPVGMGSPVNTSATKLFAHDVPRVVAENFSHPREAINET